MILWDNVGGLLNGFDVGNNKWDHGGGSRVE